MTDEDFLSRWSRRKRAAEEDGVKKSAATPAIDKTPPQQDASPVIDEQKAPAPAFDPASLPSLDTITATTDITAFLRQGVPLELSRAALRRAWSADPAIRDFVGLAENAWDFNDPNAMPGFGPLDQTPEQVRDMVARLMGETKPVPTTDVAPSETASMGEQSAESSVRADDIPHPDTAIATPDSPQSESVNDVAMQKFDPRVEEDRADAPAKLVRRTHGGALPR